VAEDLVYVMRMVNDGSMLKIGHSVNPRARLSSMRSGNPHGLVLLATLPGGKDEERRLHRRFLFDRVRGTREWFYLNAPVHMWFAEMLSNGTATALVPRDKMFR
jgi:hypothetical protein